MVKAVSAPAAQSRASSHTPGESWCGPGVINSRELGHKQGQLQSHEKPGPGQGWGRT